VFWDFLGVELEKASLDSLSYFSLEMAEREKDPV
jgi:hypothetical protein